MPWHDLQDKELYSFGRPTYGRLGRNDVDANSDLPVPEAEAVSGNVALGDNVAVEGMAAGMSLATDYASQI